VQVKNRGVIPPRRMQTLFEPMGGSSRRSDTSRGLGLGLFITRELVRAHGGSIQVRCDRRSEAAPEEIGATTFAVCLPRRSESAGGE
jgi:signal transduction histidine kinase